MSFEFKGSIIETDNEGYLKDKDVWTEELMLYMAKLDGLDLTQSHKAVIFAVRDYHNKYATTPAIRMLIKFLKTEGLLNIASSVELAKLFPDGAAKCASRYAGLPKPVKCI